MWFLLGWYIVIPNKKTDHNRKGTTGRLLAIECCKSGNDMMYWVDPRMLKVGLRKAGLRLSACSAVLGYIHRGLWMCCNASFSRAAWKNVFRMVWMRDIVRRQVYLAI